MRIAVCAFPANESGRLCAWLCAGFAKLNARPEIVTFSKMEEFWPSHSQQPFEAVVVGAGGSAGFLAARRLREADRRCAIAVVDDSEQYAIACLRLHAADFVLRPYGPEEIARCARALAGVR